MHKKVSRRAKTSQKKKAMNTSIKVGAIFVIFSIVISIMMWKDDKIPYANYGFINGVVTNIEKSNFDDTFKITVDYVIDNTTYTIKETTALRGLYINELISLVYNNDNYSQAEIKYGTPVFGYAAMFIFFLVGIFFLLLPIWTGSMKWEMIRPLRNGAEFEITVDKKIETNENIDAEEQTNLISKIIKPKNPMSAVMLIMSLIFIAFSLLIIGVVYESNKINIKNPCTTSGVIIGVYREYSTSGANSKVYHGRLPVVKFTVEDKEYTFTNRQTLVTFKINDTVTIIYNKSYPYQAEIKSEDSYIMYGFGSVFLLAGIFMFVTSRKVAKSL